MAEDAVSPDSFPELGDHPNMTRDAAKIYTAEHISAAFLKVWNFIITSEQGIFKPSSRVNVNQVAIVRSLPSKASPPHSVLLPNTALQQGALTFMGFASWVNREATTRTVNLT